ncbi:MAG TPA: biopolymer transporter ExbD [Gemmatimonadaceae bacterium]|nr:biopolymer transporter ExbD [Gemmatimonadaceae bacterium]
MAMSAAGGAAAGGLTNEINVTPMIDVLLVLLIIFMAAVPSMRKAIDLQLPDPQPAQQTTAPSSASIVLEVGPNGHFAINKEVVPKANLARRLREIYDPRPDKIIFVKGAATVKYQDVIEAMDIARGSGVRVIGVPPKDPS